MIFADVVKTEKKRPDGNGKNQPVHKQPLNILPGETFNRSQRVKGRIPLR
jgi:hypothetical protein